MAKKQNSTIRSKSKSRQTRALRSKKPVSVAGNPHRCGICGFLIPHEIVDASHPLAFTVDHLMPLSKGGENTWTNRIPAHKFCNGKKGSRVEVSVIDLNNWRIVIRDLLASLRGTAGMKLTRLDAQKYVRVPVIGQTKQTHLSWDLTRWEGDGGTCVALEVRR